MWSFIALLGWLLFALLAFGLRTLVQLRRTGSTGFRGFSGRGVERLGGVLFAVAIVASLLTPIAALIGWIEPLPALVDPILRGAGVMLYVLGLVGTLWAQWAMGSSWRIGVDASERTVLVTTGPFRWVRNPIFTAMIVCTLGLVLLVPSVLALAALAVLIVGIELQVRLIEEPYLVRVHGEAYRAWTARVGRFVPLLGLGV